MSDTVAPHHVDRAARQGSPLGAGGGPLRRRRPRGHEPAQDRRRRRDEPPHAALPLRLEERIAVRGGAGGRGSDAGQLGSSVGGGNGGSPDGSGHPGDVAVRRRPGAGGLRAPLLRPLRPGPSGRRAGPAAPRRIDRELARCERHPRRGAGHPAPTWPASMPASVWPWCGGCCSTCWPRETGPGSMPRSRSSPAATRARGGRPSPDGGPATDHVSTRLVAAPVAGHDREDHASVPGSIRREPSAMAVA